MQSLISAPAPLADDQSHVAAPHLVRFFRDGRFPARRIAAFLHRGIVSGGQAALAFARPAHLDAISAELATGGVDVGAARDAGRLVMRDAEEIARLLVPNESPEPRAFDEHVAGTVQRAVTEFGGAFAYGEIVDVLARAGDTDSALELERWWNRLLRDHPVRLLCGYGLASFASGAAMAAFRQICSEHQQVEPAGDEPDEQRDDEGDGVGGKDAALAEDGRRVRAELQQAVSALETEIQHRHLAQAETTRLLQAEQLARMQASAASMHLARLQQLTSALSEAVTFSDIAAATVAELETAFGADIAVFAVAPAGSAGARTTDAAPADDGGSTNGGGLVEAAPADVLPPLTMIGTASMGPPGDPPAPLVAAFASGQPVWLTSPAAIAAAHPDTIAAVPGVEAVGCVPLVVRGRRLGALGLFYKRAQQDGTGIAGPQIPRALLDDYARQVALAVERAHVYEEAECARRRSEDERRRAEEANAAKDEFLAMLGHELRNPLSPILTAAQLMRLRGGDLLAKERTIIERQVSHMVRLIDDLLDVSRITRGKVELRRAQVEIAEVLATAIEMASPVLEAKAHRLVTSVPISGLAVLADANRLAQVLANLLTNAAKYTSARGVIEVCAAGRDRRVEIEVRDNGAGIDADLLPRIFDLFVQGKQASDRARGGLGLGLAIARNLVELHGGTIRAESAGPGKGSTFIVDLELCQPKQATAAGLRSYGKGSRGESDGRRLLVVDDNVDAATALADVLEDAGYHVRTAHDGPSALAMAAEVRPALALLDLGLPVMDGYELGRRLVGLLGEGAVKLVAVTGYGQEADHRRSRDAGFADHMVKPIEIERLETVLARLLPDGPGRGN